MSKVSHQYAAGLIDGEGSVMLERGHAGRWRAPSVSITSTTFEFLEAMQETYGGHISRHTAKTDKWREARVWAIHGNACLAMLEQVYPFMLEPKKRARAVHLVVNYKYCTVRNGKYSPEQTELKQRFEDKFFAL